MTGTSIVSEAAASAAEQTRPAASPRGAPRRSLIVSGIGGIGASLCCVVPFVLVLLGAGGAYISTLTALAPYRPIFIGLTLVSLALAFRKLYLLPRACDPGTHCAEPAVLRRQRIVFWTVSVILAALIAFPWYAPLLLA